MKRAMTKEELWNLRNQIVLNSLYVSDYRNNFGIPEREVCNFFDSFLDNAYEEMMEDGALEDIPDKDRRSYVITRYDNSEDLYEYYGLFEEDTLPVYVYVPEKYVVHVTQMWSFDVIVEGLDNVEAEEKAYEMDALDILKVEHPDYEVNIETLRKASEYDIKNFPEFEW